MKIDATFWSNLTKILITLTAITFEAIYVGFNKALPPIDQQVSLAIFIGLIWGVWSPIDAGKFIKNLKELKQVEKDLKK